MILSFVIIERRNAEYTRIFFLFFSYTKNSLAWRNVSLWFSHLQKLFDKLALFAITFDFVVDRGRDWIHYRFQYN